MWAPRVRKQTLLFNGSRISQEKTSAYLGCPTRRHLHDDQWKINGKLNLYAFHRLVLLSNTIISSQMITGSIAYYD